MAMPVVKMVTLNTILLLYKCTCKNIATLFLGIVLCMGRFGVRNKIESHLPIFTFYVGSVLVLHANH